MQLSPVRQAELHSDLKIQEKDELLWKKLKVEGLDENGEKEAQLRRNFNGETLNVLRDQNLFWSSDASALLSGALHYRPFKAFFNDDDRVDALGFIMLFKVKVVEGSRAWTANSSHFSGYIFGVINSALWLLDCCATLYFVSRV